MWIKTSETRILLCRSLLQRQSKATYLSIKISGLSLWRLDNWSYQGMCDLASWKSKNRPGIDQIWSVFPEEKNVMKNQFSRKIPTKWGCMLDWLAMQSLPLSTSGLLGCGVHWTQGFGEPGILQFSKLQNLLFIKWKTLKSQPLPSKLLGKTIASVGRP